MMLAVKTLPANAGDVEDMGPISEFRKIPGRKEWQPTPVFMARGAWRATVHGVALT